MFFPFLHFFLFVAAHVPFFFFHAQEHVCFLHVFLLLPTQVPSSSGGGGEGVGLATGRGVVTGGVAASSTQAGQAQAVETLDASQPVKSQTSQ